MPTTALRKIFVTMLAVVVLSAPAAWAAKQVIIITREGKEIRGELVTQNADEVVVKIAGISTPFVRADVREIRVVKSVREQYLEKKAKIDKADLPARKDLAEWLYREKAYDLAKIELDALAPLLPDDRVVELLRRRVDLLLKQQPKPVTPPPSPDPDTPDPPDTPQPPKPDAAPAMKLLTDEDVNWIRLYEFNLEERRKPPVFVSKEAIDKIFENYQDQEAVPKGRTAQAAFRRAKGEEQLALLFTLRARELYDQVEVRGDPEAMRTFRINIHRNYVLSYCASVECHGGPRGGNLYLYRTRTNEDNTVYTNFYILNQFGNKEGYMIDRDAPERSLLLQYGMTREAAATPHPEVPGWRPAFRSTRDPQYQRTMQWIANELYRPAPKYPIEYVPPRVGAPAGDDDAEGAENPSPAAPGAAAPGPAKP